jgi:hypothetical protein
MQFASLKSLVLRQRGDEAAEGRSREVQEKVFRIEKGISAKEAPKTQRPM